MHFEAFKNIMPEGHPLRNAYKFFMLLHSLCVVPSTSLFDGCPHDCNCKWKNGKQTVECHGVNLVGIPDVLSAETQVLDLTGNLLQILPSRVFHDRNLINLQKIYVSHSGILSIADDAFYQLNNLVDLDLSSNFLTWVPVAALRDVPFLRRLLLGANPIQRLENDSFSALTHLTTLELNGCLIQAVEPRAFNGLNSLEYLKLNGNQIKTLPPEFVKPFSTLYALELHQNPWTCDCHLRSLRQWMLRHNIPISSPPECANPVRLRGFKWDNVSIDEFACKPRVSVLKSVVSPNEGDNATLGCRVHSTPEGVVHWIWRGRIINNLTLMSFGRQMYLIREVGTTFKVNSLTIFNVMLKDSGQYICASANPAGRVSANITLKVKATDESADALSGEEIAGIVIGALFVLFAVFFVFSFFMLRHQSLFPHQSKSGRQNPFCTFSMNNPYEDDATNQGHVKFSPISLSLGKSSLEIDSLRPEYRFHPNAAQSTGNWSNAPLNRQSIRETEKGIEMQPVPEACEQLLLFKARSNHERTEYTWPPQEEQQRKGNMDSPRWLDESYNSYDSPSQSSWKNSLILPQHIFAPKARDSPDEGLGDETDILD